MNMKGEVIQIRKIFDEATYAHVWEIVVEVQEPPKLFIGDVELKQV